MGHSLGVTPLSQEQKRGEGGAPRVRPSHTFRMLSSKSRGMDGGTGLSCWYGLPDSDVGVDVDDEVVALDLDGVDFEAIERDFVAGGGGGDEQRERITR